MEDEANSHPNGIEDQDPTQVVALRDHVAKSRVSMLDHFGKQASPHKSDRHDEQIANLACIVQILMECLE